MFSLLFDTVFPALGTAFGVLAAFASSSYNFLMTWLFPPDIAAVGWFLPQIKYVNVFTGAIQSISSPLAHLTPVLGGAFNLVRKFMCGWGDLFGVGDLPVWVALVVLSFSGYILFYFIRFFVDLLKSVIRFK